jgi:predicted unusual protein kinase regulating ubiquinone biosynthesis (AarF/ABC1/UbiB family)
MLKLLYNFYNAYSIYKEISNMQYVDEINMDALKCLKERIFNSGCVIIKFSQWIISKMKTDALHNKNIDTITSYFEDIFSNCPKQSIEYRDKLFKNQFNINIYDLIHKYTLVTLASGSIGQVYKAELLYPIYIYNEVIYLDDRYSIDLKKQLINDETNSNNVSNKDYLYYDKLNHNDYQILKNSGKNIKEITEIAIKVKHEGVNNDVVEKNTIFYLLSRLQKINIIKQFLNLNVDFMDFINNVNQQINLKNEEINGNKFRYNFRNDPLVYFPKIIISSNDIVISEYIECDTLDTYSEHVQNKVCHNFACIISKMVLIDNFCHLDLHHHNWKVRQIEYMKKNKMTQDYQIVVFDFGIIFSSINIDINRELWDVFESTEYTKLYNNINHIVVGDITQEVKLELQSILDYYQNSTLDLSYILTKLNELLSKYNCHLSSFTMNFALLMILIDNILKRYNIINSIKPKAHHSLVIREKKLDLISYCRAKNCYLDLEKYNLKCLEKINNYIKENNIIDTNKTKLFCKSTNEDNKLILDPPE